MFREILHLLLAPLRSIGDNPPLRSSGVVALTRVMLSGCAVGALLGSEALVSWAEIHPGFPEWLRNVLIFWNDVSTSWGFSKLHPFLRSAVEAVRRQ